jgi:hypothetical protein
MPAGASIDTMESFVQSALPQRAQDEVLVTAVAYDRPAQKGVYPPRNELKKQFPVSSRGWFNLVDEWRRNEGKECGGISSVFQDPFLEEKMYLPFVDFNPGFLRGSREEVAFYDALAENFPGKKFYVFESGASHHGMLASMLDVMGSNVWFALLTQHTKIVDQKWVSMGAADGHVLRTTSARGRIVPRLTRWWYL